MSWTRSHLLDIESLTAEEITLFDSSGVGILDVAASARAYELALERGSGRKVRL